jgi:outer membrane protein insertion porin family
VFEGDPFSVLLVNKSINEIKARNIFGKVEYKMLPGSSDDLRVLEISVEEKPTGEIMAGAGVGTDGTSFMFSVNENNWLGKGNRLESSLNLSAEQVVGGIKINNPNYNYTGNAVNMNFDVSSTDRSASSGFKSKKTGFILGTSFEQYENVFFSPQINLAFEDIEVDSSASTAIKNMEGNFFNTDFTYGLTLDKRDMAFRPTEGYRTTFVQSLPIVQDSSAIMNGLNVDVYHDFSEDIIGSLKFYARSINGIDDDVRLTKRLYIPRKRLRGFDSYSVGPKDGTDYIGGNYTTALSAEAQLPNLLPESYKTDFSLFLDTGNVWSVDYSDSIDETNMIRSSIGVGANVYTPIDDQIIFVSSILSL